MKKNEAPQVFYTQEDIFRKIEPLVKATHNYFAGMNKNHKCQFETFGEWRKEHPTHRLANKNYPKNEYVIVISQYFEYFNARYDKPEVKIEI